MTEEERRIEAARLFEEITFLSDEIRRPNHDKWS
jgi:hypothetical protein